MQISQLILTNLIQNESYLRKVFPYLKESYFDNPSDAVVFKIIKGYIEKYNRRPSQDVLNIELETFKPLSQEGYNSCKQLINNLASPSQQELDWLINTTEKWAKERAIFNGLTESLDIFKDKTGKKPHGAIIKILEDAISVSFDQHIGHDWLDDADFRYELYHTKEVRIPFDIDKLNEISGGGLSKKSLMIIMAGVNVGKTAAMCHMSAAHMLKGKNVLYLTAEMGETVPGIAERIDANLLDTPMNELKSLSKEAYYQKVEQVRKKTPGKLIIHEYPTGAANVNHFRHLLHELRFKKKFVPDILYIDYLNILCSSRIKMTAHIGLYSYVQAIVQEVRGLAVEYDLPIITATQLNREGYVSSDPGMEHIAESFGTAATADLIIAITITDELASLNQIMIKQIKNRFGDVHKNERFIIGRDIDKMRLYNVDRTAVSKEVVHLHQEKFDEKKKIFAEFK
jgi:replicative DNA helicase